MMTMPNPYESSELPAQAKPYPPGTLTLARALGFVLLAMATFGVIGALLGLAIGCVMPHYYARLFGLSDDESAVAASVLLGLMQGGGTGIAVGVLLAGIIAWLQARMQTIEAGSHIINK